jgi:hypothetical protein
MAGYWPEGRRVAAVGSWGLVLTWMAIASLSAQRPAAQPEREATDAQSGRVHVGTQKCAACHFQQYRTWRESKHAHAFDILPVKYRRDASCLKCHTTGHGLPSGYKDDTTANLAQVSCEACHGPGSEHAQIAIGFLEKEITAAAEEQIRGSIEMLVSNVCLDCHVTAMHKPHPEYDKE